MWCDVSQNPLVKKKKEMHNMYGIGEEIVNLMSTIGLAYASDN